MDYSKAKLYARIAGVLYLVVIVCGIFAEFGSRMSNIVPDDAAATSKNILENISSYRLGIVADVIANTSYFFLAWALYVILSPTGKHNAMLFMLMTVISAAITGLNMVNQSAALDLLSNKTWLKSFSDEQLQSLTLHFLDTHKQGYIISQVYFGGWMIPLAWGVKKSGMFPKIFFYLLLLAGSGYVIDFVLHFLLPAQQAVFAPFLLTPVALAETSFALWLLIKGVKKTENLQ